MSCTKAQILALLTKIKKDMRDCRTVSDCFRVIERYIEVAEEKAGTEAWFELIT